MTALSATTWDHIYAYLSARFGCPGQALREPDIRVQPHGPWLADYHGIYVWRMGSSVLISAPAPLIEETRAVTQGHAASDLTLPAFWLGALGPRVARVVGPSYQAYLDANVFQPASERAARPLAETERPMLEAFARACPALEWEHSAIQPDHRPIMIVMDGAPDEKIVAAASYTAQSAHVASVGVLTRPEARGRGYGRAAVSALTRYALTQGYVLHYQTLRANGGSMAIARALGYVEAATAIAVRLQTR